MPYGEFTLIDRLLRPLAAGHPASLGLVDDAAVLDCRPGEQIVLTKDAMVEGVHVLPDDPPDLVARKLVRRNLSDLAAMGADPLGYLLALARRRDLADAWLEGFAAGLARDQEEFGIALLGGDTVGTPGPITLTLTALGTVPAGEALRRGGARPGDDIHVSGTLGDGALGLRVLKGELDASPAAREALADRYRLPRPRLALGRALRGLAHAALDVSDGLVADLGHIVLASGVGAEVEAARLPLSSAARGLPGALEAALAGGDDYELLFAAAPEARDRVDALARDLDLPIARIGRLREGAGVRVVGADGAELPVARGGWTHF
ncbi:MAG TPA: thiamine-phosphate kinase [Geminicoccaceae bacterium]|nr:thiamine-phosphate kinase [Geminicoccaceae bacterium]